MIGTEGEFELTLRIFEEAELMAGVSRWYHFRAGQSVLILGSRGLAAALVCGTANVGSCPQA